MPWYLVIPGLAGLAVMAAFLTVGIWIAFTGPRVAARLAAAGTAMRAEMDERKAKAHV
jgi:hypothetical protein